jgi:hypothetical protein
LRPFKPGDVGNPTGRNQYTKARESFQAAVEAAAAQIQDKDGLTLVQALAHQTLKDALAKDGNSRHESLERLWPKVQTILTGQDPETTPAQLEVRQSIAGLSDEDRETIRKIFAKSIAEG